MLQQSNTNFTTNLLWPKHAAALYCKYWNTLQQVGQICALPLFVSNVQFQNHVKRPLTAAGSI